MLDLFFIIGAKYLFFLSLIVAGIYFFRTSSEARKKLAISFLLLLPLTYAVGLGARQLYDNPRPFVVGGFEPLIEHEADNGFPSDHVLLVAALSAGFIFFNRRAALWLGLIAVVVALSRVYAGVHHFLDIGASMVIALACAIIVGKIYGSRTK